MQDNSQAIDLSAGLVQKPEGIDLSAGLRPLAVNLPGGTPQLTQQVQNNPLPGDQTQPTEFEKEHSPEGQPGVLKSFGENILSKVESLPRFFSGMGGTNAAKRGYDAIEHDQQRQSAGRSLPYRAAAYAGDLLGISNPTVQEQAAEHGNVRGVAGNAIADLAPAVAPLAAEGLRVAAPQIAEGTNVLRDAAADSLKESATRQYQKVLAPTKEATKFIAKKITPEALNRGVVARSGPALEQQAASHASSAGQAIDDAVDALPRSPTIATEPIIKHLESYKQEFINQIPVTDQEFHQLAAQGKPVNILEDGTKVKEVNLDPDAVNRINQMQQIIKDHGDMVDYESLRKARQVFDEKVAKANGYAGKTLSEGAQVDVQREAASAIRRELAKDNPDIAKLNAEYSFWENLRKVAAETNKRRVGQQGGLGQKIAQSTGATVGAVVGGPKGALIGAAAGKRFSQLFSSAAWRTASAVTKNKVANMLASGDSSGALNALSAQPAKALPPKSPLPFLNPPEGTQAPSSASPLPFLKPAAEAQPAATGTTGQGFLDLLNKSVSSTKRDAGLDETIATEGAVPRGYDPVTGGYAFEVPTRGGLSQKVLPADQITPESIRQAKSSANGGNGAKPQGSPVPNPEDVQMANRYRVGQLQKSLRKSSDQQERTELQSAINQITEQLPKRSEAPFSGQERRNQPEISPAPQQSGIPNPGYAGQVPVAAIKQAPHRFQYKLNTDAEGVGTLLKEQNNYNPDLAGVISVWRDPADGQLYVVNGHHRLELAKRTGQTSVLARHIVAKDANEARAIGALQNIAEGRGTAIDAAKFMRDTGISVDDLKAKGISMGEATAAKGSALSNLDDSLFNKTVQGEMPLERAAAIGDATPDHAEQRAISDLIDRQEKKGKKVNNDTLRELVRFVKGSGQSQETTLGLFGAESVAKSHALEKAEVSSYIKQQLSKDKKLFGFVSKGDRADELERGNNIIDVKSSKALADEATQGEEVYNKLSERSGPIADVLDYAAARIAGGENPNAVKQEAYSNIRTEITQALGGSKAASPQRRTAAREASLGTSDEKPQYRQPARKEHGNIEPLTNDELASWSKSRSLKIEEAGQQGGLFGGAEKMYRVSRIGSDGERESALVPESKINKLRETNTHVQKLVAQPALFGPISKNKSPLPWLSGAANA